MVMGMNAWCCRGLCQRLCHVGAIGYVSVPVDVLVDEGMSAHHMLEDVQWLYRRMHWRMFQRVFQRMWIVLVDVPVNVLS